ncbi:MAG: hypothetical protein ACTSYO_09425 [Candidatus Ranarchaeia archaeon]
MGISQPTVSKIITNSQMGKSNIFREPEISENVVDIIERRIQETSVAEKEEEEYEEDQYPPEESETIRWLLYRSVSGIDWKSALERATEDELRYCIEHNNRILLHLITYISQSKEHNFLSN